MPEIKFEDALKKLEKIVEDLEKGDLSLDEALKKYQEGNRNCTESERNRDPGHQHQQRDNEDDCPLGGWAHGAPPSASCAWARATSSAACLS